MCKKWQYLAQNDQKCRFWTRFCRFLAKILIFMGVSKSFGTNITENHQDNLSALFFGQALDQMRQNADIWHKMPILGQIWPFLGPKSNFLGAGSKILVPSYRDSNETPFLCWKHWSARLQLAARGENVLFLPQNLDIWGQKSIFCLVIAIFVDGANDHYTRGSNFPIGTTPKKFSVSELGVIFWGSPLFLAVFGHWRVRRATTLNFGPISTKLGGIVRAIKKMTQKDNR